MIAATQITEQGGGSIPGNAMQMSIYFVVYIIVIPFFFLKLFIALIIVTFQEEGEEELEKFNIDENQVNTQTHGLIHTRVRTYTHKYSYTHKHTNAHKHTCMHIYIRTYVYIHTLARTKNTNN